MVMSRIWFTAQQKGELWERWKSGQSVAAISRALERRNKTGVERIVALHGGIAPAPRRRAPPATAVGVTRYWRRSWKRFEKRTLYGPCWNGSFWRFRDLLSTVSLGPKAVIGWTGKMRQLLPFVSPTRMATIDRKRSFDCSVP
jgi:hypothetical protein